MAAHTYTILAPNVYFIPTSEGNYIPYETERYATLYDLLPANHAETLEYDPSILKGTIAVDGVMRNHIADIKFIASDTFDQLPQNEKTKAARIDNQFMQSKNQRPAWLIVKTR